MTCGWCGCVIVSIGAPLLHVFNHALDHVSTIVGMCTLVTSFVISCYSHVYSDKIPLC